VFGRSSAYPRPRATFTYPIVASARVRMPTIVGGSSSFPPSSSSSSSRFRLWEAEDEEEEAEEAAAASRARFPAAEPRRRWTATSRPTSATSRPASEPNGAPYLAAAARRGVDVVETGAGWGPVLHPIRRRTRADGSSSPAPSEEAAAATWAPRTRPRSSPAFPSSSSSSARGRGVKGEGQTVRERSNDKKRVSGLRSSSPLYLTFEATVRLSCCRRAQVGHGVGVGVGGGMRGHYVTGLIAAGARSPRTPLAKQVTVSARKAKQKWLSTAAPSCARTDASKNVVP
jgi:hypothetical protein